MSGGPVEVAKPSDQWENAFAELLAFVESHGNASVPQRFVTAKGVRLGYWVAAQRQSFRKGQLNASRASRLEALQGWVWKVQATTWDAMFAKLTAYAREQGHANVPQRFVTVDGIPLGTWVRAQRSDGKRGRLSDVRVSRLEKLPGWSWGRTLANQWEEAFIALSMYVQQNDEPIIPEDLITPQGIWLSQWIRNQRRLYRTGELPPDRTERLETLPSWTWEPLSDRWEAMFAELVKFVDTQGHARVPSSYITEDGHKLGVWVVNQRHHNRTGALSADRAARLQAFPGWQWDAHTAVVADKWTAMFNRFSKYVARTGHIHIAHKDRTHDGVHLGCWASRQRAAYRNGTLTPDQIAKLENLPGWSWSPRPGRAARG